MLNLPRNSKVKMIHEIASEDILRVEVLIPIFRNMNTFHAVVDTHGPDEKGKDVVLAERDGFGDLVYTAVIIKNKRIMGGTQTLKDRETSTNLALQVTATLLSTYPCTIQNQRVKFNKIIVFTSRNISNSAREDLVNVAARYQFNNIHFRQDEDLVALIDEYLPEFYSFSSGRIASYVQAVKKKCERLDELRNISIYHGEIKRILDVFVEPRLYRETTKTVRNRTRVVPVFNRLQQAIFERGNILLLGEAGSGKSTLLRAQVQQLLDLNTKGKQMYLPILARAADLVTYTGETFETILSEHIRNEYDVQDFDVGEMASSNAATLFIFLDGLDEIRDRNEVTQLLDKTLHFAASYPHHKVVISSRDNVFLNEFSLSGFTRWRLMPFQTRQVRSFISRWCAKQETESGLLSALRNHDLLDKLPNTPLVLTLLAILFDQDINTDIPANLSELYQMFLDLLLGRWNLDRKAATFYKPTVKEFVLMELADALHSAGAQSMPMETFRNIVCNSGKSTGYIDDPDALIKELLEDTCIIVLNDRREIEFRHLSFQEFLLAKRLKQRTNDRLIEDLVERFQDDWWSPVVYFFAGLRLENPDLLQAISRKMRSYEPRTSIKTAWTFGYLIQASYLTPLQVREQCIADQVRLYTERLTELMEEVMTGKMFMDVPPAMLFLGLFDLFKVHFSARALKGSFEDIFAELYKKGGQSSTADLGLLLCASILADQGNENALCDAYEVMKSEPLANVALEFELKRLLEPDKKAGERVRSTALKIRRRFTRGWQAYKNLFEPRRTGLPESAATSDDDESVGEH